MPEANSNMALLVRPCTQEHASHKSPIPVIWAALAAVAVASSCAPPANTVSVYDLLQRDDTSHDAVGETVGPDSSATDLTETDSMDIPCSPDTPCPVSPCAKAECDPSTGLCVWHEYPDENTCDDLDACTTADRCTNGVCIGNPIVCLPSGQCQSSACDPQSGLCLLKNISAACDDQNPCTTNDACQDGTCTGITMVCEDANPCTTDACSPQSGCTHVPLQGLPCQLSNSCEKSGFCSASGVCTPEYVINCSDDNPCTNDSCSSTDGSCSHTPLPNGTPCVDISKCFVNPVCKGGVCSSESVIDCNDTNPCTTDACVPGVGCSNSPTASACDDGNPCTENDTCAASVCMPGQLRNCSDGNICTQDWCDPEDGACLHEQTNWPCSDGSLCTTGDQCSGGKCTGSPVNCDDNNVCTVDGCDPESGCFHVPTSSSCSDSNPCTLGDTCSAGLCVAGSLVDCDDNNPCTSDQCSPDTGLCEHLPAQGQCDDGNPCSLGDYCKDTTCQAGNVDWCECGGPLDCLDLDDGNLCNGVLFCDQSAWPFRCRILPGSTVTCSTEADTQCSRAVCQPETGTCTMTPRPDGYSCSDDDACTGADSCDKGECQPGDAVVCDDHNVCTSDACYPEYGCTFEPATGSCDDDNLCTYGDACYYSTCIGKPKWCDDNNPCTSDSCDMETGECLNVAYASSCSDGNQCTTNDTCVGTVCIGTPRDCDDKNPCTTDSCSISLGCVFEVVVGWCDDNNACTLDDVCNTQGICSGSLLMCNDDNDCTTDWCDPQTGCVFQPNSATCNDDNWCTMEDHCQAGQCVGEPLPCDDGNPCRAYSCHRYAGCIYEDLDIACSDYNSCTVGDWCIDGNCVSGTEILCDDKNGCTSEWCNAMTGECEYYFLSSACDDSSLCTEADHCQMGFCVGQPVICGDENACTADECVPTVGCTHTPLTGTWCTDGNICTVGDICSSGSCISGPPKSCDDLDECTQDACEPGLGCVHDPVPGCE